MLATLLTSAVASSVWAQAQPQPGGFSVNRFEPAGVGSEWFTLESLDFRGHMRVGASLVGDWADRPLVIFDQNGAEVAPLVRNHLIHFQTVTDRSIRRLAKRLEPESIENLCVVITADCNGRPPQPPTEPESVKMLLSRAHELQVRHKPPEPILLGRHLLEIGLAPGPDFGVILGAAYEAQLEGVFFDLTQARRWLAETASVPLTPEARERMKTF